MLVNISAEFPREIEAAAATDMRASFRRAIENVLRGRMDTLVGNIKRDAHYQAIAKDYRVEQASAGEEIAFAVVNDNPHSQYLIPGTQPHIIRQAPHMVPLDALLKWSGGDVRMAKVAQARIAVRGVTIHHPGTVADQPVLEDVAAAEPAMIEATADAADRWTNTFGTGGEA